MQKSLLRPKLRIRVPAGTGTADIRHVGIALDNTEWYIKTIEDHPLLPITEWIGHHVAEACGLPVPYYSIVDHEDEGGVPVFGSRTESGLEDPFKLLPAQQVEQLMQCASTMSATVAIDMVLGNEDRHRGNFLYRRNRLGQASSLVIDWSRAFGFRGIPPPDIPADCNTAQTHNILRGLKLWDSQSALAVIAATAAIDRATMTAWVEEAPLPWLPEPARANLIGWWSGDAFMRKIRACTESCK